jgi:phospholipid/cholesterol/gamma-HCH transport system substrate-binding protein
VTTAIRKHQRDFLAIIGLLVLAGFVTSIILSNQRLTLPSWVPVVGKDFYEFNAKFVTAQAVTPGQGQTVNVAGVKVGEIAKVELADGTAVIGMKLDKGTVIVHTDATMLLRPKTGLKDMVVELDPGSGNAPKLQEGGTIPVSQTAPDVNLDEVLSALDGDTRTYLQALLSAGDTGLEGRGDDLGDTIRAFKPTAKALSKINGALATRRANIKRVIHNFSLLADELGSNDDELARFVDSSNAVLGVLARQESSIRATLRGLPGALGDTKDALGKTRDLADELGPSLQALRPAARRLGPTLQQVRPFLRTTTPVIRDSVRPLVREARPLVAELRPTMRNLSAATPDLLTTLKIVNTAVDALAYNPAGEEEGSLFWFAWVNHLGASLFNTQDAHGVVRRGLVLASCETLGILDNVKQVNPLLGTIVSLSNFPATSAVCAQQQARK